MKYASSTFINDFIKALDFIKNKRTTSDGIYDYSKAKEEYYVKLYNSKFNELISRLSKITELVEEGRKARIIGLIENLKILNEKKDYKAIKNLILKNLNLFEIEQKKDWFEQLIIKTSRNRFPKEIREEIIYDLHEILKCYNAKAYRAVVVLCSRVLEIALHRKYYDSTGIDLLEKAPGIGLGNLIAKLREKGIEVDPALMQQIHLINQIRIFSVHKKKYFFDPSNEQVQAIILYTVDLLNKLF